MLFRRYSLHKRLLLVFSVLGTALVCLSIFLNTLIGRSFKQDISERNLRLASSIASQVEVTLTHHGDELWQLSQNITQAPAGDPIVQKMMRSTLSYHPLIERIYLLDKNGRVLRVVPDNPHLLGLDMSNQPYYTERDTVLNYVLWNDAYISSEIGRQTVAMSIYTGDLTLAAHLYLDELGEIIRSEYPVTEGFVTIIDGKGMPIAGADEQMETTGINFLELTSVRNALGGIEGSYEERIGGERGLSSACLIQDIGWAVLIFQPKAGTFGAVDRLLKLTSIVLLLAFVVAMLISLGLLKRIMNPIRNLVTQTRSVASGGYNVSVKTEYTEFQELAESFNQMARSIEAREDELKISESRYRELFFNNPLPVMIFDAEDLTILDVSLAAVEDYGYSRDEFIGMSMLQIRLKEEVQSASQIIRTENTGMRKAGTWKHRKKDGSVIYVDITSHEIPYVGKRAILCICRDVTSNILVGLW